MSRTVSILTVLGSLQRRSFNRLLLEIAAAHPPAGVTLVPAVSLDSLPHFNADLDGEDTPVAVRDFRAQVTAADAVLFASPEYGHGMPGTLKNALDWLVGSGELAGKPVAAVCAAQGPDRGKLGLASLVQTLRAEAAVVAWSDTIIVQRVGAPQDAASASAELIQQVQAVIARLGEAVVR